MSKDTYFISDTHFGHANILNFVNQDTGLKVRPEFSSVEEMNESMISAWNNVVKPGDSVYHLGDFCFDHDFTKYAYRLNGNKRLILGNHDRITPEYFKYFHKIGESLQMNEIVFTHRPILLDEKNEMRIKYNVHGHIHEKIVNDDRYLNISVEQIHYTPIHLEEIISIFKSRGYEVKIT